MVRRSVALVALVVALVVPVTGASGTTSSAAEPEQPWGWITGVVTDDTGTPLADAVVEARILLGTGETESFAETRTGTDGGYRLYVWADRDFYVSSEKYGWLGVTWDEDPDVEPSRTAVRVGADGATRDGVDLVLSRAEEIVGTVRGPDGEPVAGIDVMVVPRSEGTEPWPEPRWDIRTPTVSDGRFHFYVPPGTYRVVFRDHRQMYNDGSSTWPTQVYPAGAFLVEGEDVLVEEGDDPVELAMTMATAASITGTARPYGFARWAHDLGEPQIPDVTVYRQVEGEWRYLDVWARLVDVDGRYVVPLLLPGKHVVEFSGSSTHEDRWLGGVTKLELARRYDLGGGETVSGQEVTMPAKGIIRGTVRDSRGRPVAGAYVRWRSPSGGQSLHNRVTTTDGQGRYELLGLAPNFYRVGVVVVPRGPDTVYSWWPGTRDLAGAVDIGIDRGELRRRVDLTVPATTRRTRTPPTERAGRSDTVARAGDRGALAGRVLGPTGADVMDVTVLAYRQEGSRWVLRGRALSHRNLGLGPRYSIALPRGRYRLQAVDRAWRFYAPEWYGGARRAAAARVIDFRPEIHSGVTRWNFRLDGGVRTIVAPRVRGRAVRGARLTVAVGLWSPDDTRRTYQWLRDGRPIHGATGTSYRVTSGDVGHRLRVRVIGRRPGLLPHVATSRPSATIR